MTDPAFALQSAMRAELLSHAPLIALLKGAHVYDEVPRGQKAPFVVLSLTETRDWSVKDQKAHEHFVTVDIKSNARGRKAAQAIVSEIDQRLDNAVLTLQGHTLINLRLIFWTVVSDKQGENFNGVMRFRAATEPV